VIAEARKLLKPGERLVVNPTSGTKQMSCGAMLAALDEELGEVMFTVGERSDGVVKTGTEERRTFSTEAFFLERDLRIAESLFAHGSFLAAARVLEGHRQSRATRARDIALCLHEWQRMHYAGAAGHAARFSESVRAHIKRLADEDEFSPLILGDLLAGADELLRWGYCEEALARYYRGAEQAAKVRLPQEHGIRPPYRLGDFVKALPGGCAVADELRKRAHENQLQIGSDLAWRILEAAGDPMAIDFFADSRLQKVLWLRNLSVYGHGQSPMGQAQVQAVADRLRDLLGKHSPAVLAGWTSELRPRFLA
jgi:hypothetical protein